MGAQIGDSNRINHLRALWGKNRGEGRRWVAYTGGAESGMLPELMICLRRRVRCSHATICCDRESGRDEAGADELVSAVVVDDDDDAGRPLRERDSE